MAAFVLTILLLFAGPAIADEISNDTCLGCHGIEGFANPDGRVLVVDPDGFSGSTHGSFSCATCHSDATAVPHAEKLQPVAVDTCATCHSDAVETYRQSVHGQARANGILEAAACGDCHGNIHAVVPHTEPTSTVHWQRLAAVCARCHANVELVEKFRIPVVRPVEAYLESAHARAVAAGKRSAVCSDCHGAHDILPNSDPRSTIWRANVPTTCGKCHGEILAAYRDSVHGEALARGVRDAPVCTDCHGEHRILAATDPKSPVFATNIPSETCGRCHANQRLNEKYGLSLGKVAAFQDSYHGLALRAGQLTVANCSSCHGVHDIHSSSDPRSHVNKSNLPQTCGKCHPGAGTRFTIGSVHGQALATGTQATYWIRAIYLWLISLVIGFMVLHNALDFGRKARRAAPPVHQIPASPAERMPRLVRWQHGLVMLSFPVLVYTGFALTYPESWWAAPLLRWETRFGLRGLIHRVAAIILLTALFWHALHLAVSRRLRSCFRGMWPSWSDVRELAARLAYYIGLRTAPPHTGTFSYIEKAEYLAFVWGMVIMTATGLLLWFADVALRYLPKWTTDVATALHFYEAVLAALAIVVWHLYWVIFDPDVYPMDWSWWNGRAPGSRTAERRGADEPPASGQSDRPIDPESRAT